MEQINYIVISKGSLVVFIINFINVLIVHKSNEYPKDTFSKRLFIKNS